MRQEVGKYQRGKRYSWKAKRGLKRGVRSFKAGAPYFGAAGVLAGGSYLYNKSLSPEEKRKRKARTKLKRELGKQSYVRQGALWGLGGMYASGFLTVHAIDKGYPRYRNWQARKAGGESGGLNDYWKKNPQAHAFYKHKMAKGDMKSVNTLLKKLKLKGKEREDYVKKNKRIRQTFKRNMKEANFKLRDFGNPWKTAQAAKGLKAGDIDFLLDKGAFQLKYGIPVVALGTVVGTGYGIYRARKARKKWKGR